MRTLQELIEANGIKVLPVYTHSVDGAPDGGKDYDVFDCLLTLEAEVSLYGGRFNARTLLFRGFGQSPTLSRRQNGDELVPPTAPEVLEWALSDALGIDSHDDWREWAREYMGSDSGAAGFEEGLTAYDKYQEAKRWRDDLVAFLGPEFEQFKNAVLNGEG